jgi:predicted transcriptional regulator
MPLRRPPHFLILMKPRPHSFSRTFAQLHSINEAIVLKHLAYKTQKSTNWKDDRQWYYDTTDTLMKKWPYLGRSTIDDVVKKLARKGMVIIGNYNKRTYDRTRWFHVPEAHWKVVEEEKINFLSSDAETHGVVAAVLMWNLEYWLNKKLKVGQETHSLNPEKLAEHLPFKASTIKSTLSGLVKSGALIKVPGKRSEYVFPPDRMRSLQTKARLT